jgi:cytochrome c oxidase subunit 2
VVEPSAFSNPALVLMGARDETVGRPPVRSHEVPRKALRRRSRAVVIGLCALVTLSLSGCTRQVERGWLPTNKNTTNQTARIMNLWNGSWIAALAVGVLVWGLIFWAVIAYRRRKGTVGVPPQIRYHIPLEIMYTIVPLMMVAVLFYYTARDESELISTKIKPDVTIGVVGKQWSWDFNYVDANTYETGTQAQMTGNAFAESGVPTLWLPVNERVQFDLTTRDVNHSFWIPAFLMKMDLIAGVENEFQVIPQITGDYVGRCAELCGEYHANMLFNVHVVSDAAFQAHMNDLRAQGNQGQLATGLGRSGLTPAEGANGPQTGEKGQHLTPEGQASKSENGNS